MTDEVSYFRFLRDRVKPILTVFAAMIVIVALPAIAVTNFFADDFSVQALWPDRLSTDTPLMLPVTLTNAKTGADLSGDVEVFLGPQQERGRDVAEAVDAGLFKSIAKGKTDREGRALIELPPTPPMKTADNEPTATALLIRVDAAGETRWTTRALQFVDAPVIALTLDRPLYQPGQTMKMRALVASATTGKSLDTKAHFVVRDARGNIVLDEQVATGANGVAATELALAARCLQGTYQVELTANGESQSRSVEVRPYRLPRFKVTVMPETDLARPGEATTVSVQAMYTYGEPVIDGDVVVAAEVGGIGLPESAGKTDETGKFTVTSQLPRNAPAGGTLNFTATVTSPAGRAEVGSRSVAVAGRSVTVDLIPAGEAHFVSGKLQTGYVVVKDQNGPLVGATVKLIVPEEKSERTVETTTDDKGRGEFRWTPANSNGNASVTVTYENAVVFKENVYTSLGTGGLRVSSSVLTVGDNLEVGTDGGDGMLVLMRDGVTLSGQILNAGESTATIAIPATAAGFVALGVLRNGSLSQQTPLWIRQRGGDTVDITLADPEVRPGAKTKVDLAFTAPEAPSENPVTFGLVAVDEALYALKERAGVPLHVLMRRAPSSIGAALGVFDGVASDDAVGAQIATSRFRAQAQPSALPYLGGDNVDQHFERHARAGWLHAFAWLCLLALIAIAVQLARWTFAAASRDAFTLKNTAKLVGASIFCGIFAAALASASGETLMGGIAVWTAIIACWLVAAAARLDGLRFDAWLLAHLLGIAVLSALGIALSDLNRSGSEFIVLQVGIALPLLLLGVQWFVWVFVLLREGHQKPALGFGSLAGILALGAFAMTLSSSGRHYEMAAAPMKSSRYVALDMAEPEEEGQPSPKRSSGPGNTPMKPSPEAPRVRSWFPETMVWLPEIAGDATGKASVDVEVPDSITTWRLNAWANTSDGRFGEGQAQLLAIQPYFVELDLPTEVIDGDEFEVPVTLVNRGETALEVGLDASTQGPLTLRGWGGESRVIEAGQRETVWLTLIADGVGEATVTVSSASDVGQGDAVRRTLTVSPDGRVLRESASAIIGKGWESRIDVPADTIANTRVAEVRLYGSLVADALAGVDSMLRMPGGCFEQTSSANYPNVMILRALRDMKPADWPDGIEDFQETHERATKLVRLGYQQILSFQQPSGGFVLYPTHAKPSVMLTAYGILQLVWASDVTQVDRDVILRAARWLVQQQNEDGSWPVAHVSGSGGGSTDIGHVRTTSFVTMALSALKEPEFRHAIDKALVRIEERLPSVESPNALAFATNALSDAGSKELALKAAAQLAALATREGDVAYWPDTETSWMGSYGRYASLETTALAAHALLATESQSELLQPTLSWLSGQRGGYGGFGTTQATVWTLRTFELLRSKSSDDATLRFYFGSDQLPTIAGATDLKVTKQPQPLRQFEFRPERNEDRFVVDSTASTSAMVQLVTEYAVDWDSRFAAVDDEPFGGEVELSRATTRGSAVRAYAKIENLRETASTMVIAELPLPPGAFVPTEALDELIANGAIDIYEVLPTHIRLYIPEIPGKAERVYAYDFVPLIRGTFSLPALRAYPYYAPEPVMEVDAGDVRTR